MLQTKKFLVAGLSMAIVSCLSLTASAAIVNGFANGGFRNRWR